MTKFTNVRIFFNKIGDAKYISHLDLYRAFGRALKRSRLPVWVTEGFNPHIYTTFALPLSLGIKSDCESVDVRFVGESGEADFAEAAERLSAVMPSGLQILRIAEPVRNACDITRARYAIRADGEQIARLDEFFAQEVILIEKKSKSKTRTLDVKPLSEWDGGSLTLPAGNELNISPWNLLDSTDAEITDITRTAILCSDGAVFA
jgi:radical SAM-linked protein